MIKNENGNKVMYCDKCGNRVWNSAVDVKNPKQINIFGFEDRSK